MPRVFTPGPRLLEHQGAVFIERSARAVFRSRPLAPHSEGAQAWAARAMRCAADRPLCAQPRCARRARPARALPAGWARASFHADGRASDARILRGGGGAGCALPARRDRCARNSALTRAPRAPHASGAREVLTAVNVLVERAAVQAPSPHASSRPVGAISWLMARAAQEHSLL